MVEPSPAHGTDLSTFRDSLRKTVAELDNEQGCVVDKEQIEAYIDDMTASRHRNLVTGDDASTPEALMRAAALRAYEVIKWRSESPLSPKMVSPDRPPLLQKLGKMYIRPGSSLRKTVVYVRPWLDPDPRRVKTSIMDIVYTAEMARLAAQHGGEGRIVLIADLSGFDFNVRVGRLAASILQDNFPHLLEAACLVNVPPHALSFVNCMLALLAPETRAKFKVFGSAPFGTTLGSPIAKDVQRIIRETLGEKDIEVEFGGMDESFRQRRHAFEEEFHTQSAALTQGGCEWRPEGIYYRANHLQVDINEHIVCGDVSSEGELLSVHIVYIVNVMCQLSGMPLLKLFFSAAERLRAAKCHYSVSECRGGVDPGEASVRFLPPDGMFELFRFTLRQGVTAPSEVGAEDISNSQTPFNDLEGEADDNPLWVEADGPEVHVDVASSNDLNDEEKDVKAGPAMPQLSEEDEFQSLLVGGFLPQDAKQSQDVQGQTLRSQNQEDAKPSDTATSDSKLVLAATDDANSTETATSGSDGPKPDEQARLPLSAAVDEHRTGVDSGEDPSPPLGLAPSLNAPLTVEATMIESADGTESITRVKLQLMPHIKRGEGIVLRAPLHPSTTPATFHAVCSAGRAYEKNGEMVWEVDSCGEAVNWIDQDEKTQEGGVVTMEAKTIIGQRFVEVNHETGDEVPCERPLGSDDGLWAITQDVWRRRRILIDAIAELDRHKKPFYRDRSKMQRVQRVQLEAAIRRMETVFASSLLAGTLAPLRISAERFHGTATSGFHLEACLLLNQHMPWAYRSTTLLACSELCFRFLPYRDIPPATHSISNPISRASSTATVPGGESSATAPAPHRSGSSESMSQGQLKKESRTEEHGVLVI